MALTQSAWTEKSVNGRYIAACTVIATVAENDAYTKLTPKGLNVNKPWTLIYYAGDTPDAQALPLDIWINWDGITQLSGDGGTVACASGAMFKQIFDDVVLAIDDTPLAYAFLMDPFLNVADVVTAAAAATGPKVKIPIAPHYAFNCDGGSTLAATTHYFTIIQ
jgi:hypothetical protein